MSLAFFFCMFWRARSPADPWISEHLGSPEGPRHEVQQHQLANWQVFSLHCIYWYTSLLFCLGGGFMLNLWSHHQRLFYSMSYIVIYDNLNQILNVVTLDWFVCYLAKKWMQLLTLLEMFVLGFQWESFLSFRMGYFLVILICWNYQRAFEL